MTLSPEAPAVSDREFMFTRTFAAPKALVYKAWTKPQHMARWWGPTCFTNPVCEMDVRPGGSFHIVMRGPAGSAHDKDYPYRGVYLEVVPKEKLVYTDDCSEHGEEWHALLNKHLGRDGGDGTFKSLVTVVFEEPEAGKTKLTVRMRMASPELKAAMLKMGMSEGWGQSMEKLAALLPTL